MDNATLQVLANLVLVRKPRQSAPAIPNEHSGDLICLSLASGLNLTSAFQKTISWLLKPLSTPNESLERKLCVALCLPHLSPLDIDEIRLLLVSEIQATYAQLDKDPSHSRAPYLLALYEAWFSFKTSSFTNATPLHAARLLDYAMRWHPSVYPGNCEGVERIDLCATYLRILDLGTQAGAVGQDILPIKSLLSLLLSYSHQIRLHALRIIQALLPETKTTDGDGALMEDDASVAVKRCLAAEQIKQTPLSLRDLLLPILHLHCGRTGIFGCALGAEVSQEDSR